MKTTHSRRATWLGVAASFLALLLHPLAGLATTYFPSSQTRPAVIRVLGTPRVHMISESGANNQIAIKTTASEWNRLTNPTGVTGFNVTTGLAGVVPSTSWGAPRVYAISNNGRLLELNYDGITASYRDVTGTNAPSLLNSPSLSAFWDGTAVWIAVGTGSSVWTCQISSRTLTCGSSWENESCFPNANNCSPLLHPAASNSAVALDTAGGSMQVSFVGSDNHVWRFNWFFPAWVQLLSPLSPAGSVPEASNLASAVIGSTVYIASTAYASGGSLVGDSLEVAQCLVANQANPTSWTWVNRTDLTDAPNGIAYARNEMALGLDSTSTSGTLWNSSVDGHKLIGVSLTTGAVSYVTGLAADQRPNTDLIGIGITAESDTKAWSIGTVGGFARYLYSYTGGSSAPFVNMLTPRDSNVTVMPAGLPQEPAIDEYYGHLFAVGWTAASPNPVTSVFESTDDGSTWPITNQPIGSTSSDQWVTIDPSSGGRVYVSGTGNPCGGPGGTFTLASRTVSGSTWGAATILPGNTYGSTGDRPFIAADPTRPGYLYATWSESSSVGRLAYCNGTGTCTPACGAGFGGWVNNGTSLSMLTLPSWNGCTGCAGCYAAGGPAGCQVAVTGTGQAWVLVEDDTDCDHTHLNTVDRWVGLRKIVTNGTSAPTVTAATCFHYTPFMQTASQGNSNNPTPVWDARWSAYLSASRDGSGDVAVILAGFTDITTGNPCTTASGSNTCRTDVFAVYRRGSDGQYCTSSGCSPSPPTQQTQMAVLNSDRGTASTPLDHALPTMMLLDQAQFIATWNDSRSSLNNNLRYTVHNAFGFVTTSGLFENADSAMLGVGVTTPQEFTYFIFPRDHSDIVGSLGYRLHAHTMSEVDNSSTSRSISTISQIFSPYTYQTPPQ